LVAVTGLEMSLFSTRRTIYLSQLSVMYGLFWHLQSYVWFS